MSAFGEHRMACSRRLVISIVLAGCAIVAACSPSHSGELAGTRPTHGFSGPAGLVAYVANTYDPGQGFIQPVCLTDGAIGQQIPVGGQPFVITVAPDGRTAYVANSGWGGPVSQSTVTPVDLVTARAFDPIPAGLGPMGIAITPDGAKAYVADMGSLLSKQSSTMVDANTVTPIDLKSGRALQPIVVGPGVGAIAITPDGKTAIIAIDGTQSHPQNYVELMDVASGRLSAPVRVGPAPMAVAITPDSRKALVTNTGWRPLGHTVTPVDLTTQRPGASIDVGNAPIDIVMTSDGKTAFVANAVGQGGNSFAKYGEVSVIDVETNSASSPITVPGVPQALAITPDGKTVFEVGMEGNLQSALASIDVTTRKVGSSIQFHHNLGAVAIARAPKGFCMP